MDERRKFSRINFPAQSHLMAGKKRYRTELIDISMKGALLKKPKGWDIKNQEHCQMELQLEDSNITLAMGMEVAHIKGNLIGLQITNIDLDSMIHLRRLLELNSGDPNLVERELFSML